MGVGFPPPPAPSDPPQFDYPPLAPVASGLGGDPISRSCFLTRPPVDGRSTPLPACLATVQWLCRPTSVFQKKCDSLNSFIFDRGACRGFFPDCCPLSYPGAPLSGCKITVNFFTKKALPPFFVFQIFTMTARSPPPRTKFPPAPLVHAFPSSFCFQASGFFGPHAYNLVPASVTCFCTSEYARFCKSLDSRQQAPVRKLVALKGWETAAGSLVGGANSISPQCCGGFLFFPYLD